MCMLGFAGRAQFHCLVHHPYSPTLECRNSKLRCQSIMALVKRALQNDSTVTATVSCLMYSRQGFR